jgi:hypothetical protein
MDIYEFSVQIWSEDGLFKWSVAQEFRSFKDLEVLGYGEAESHREAATAAGAIVINHFGAINALQADVDAK